MIKEIVDTSEWVQFQEKQPFCLFTQSHLYGKFYESLGEKSWLLGIYEQDALVGGALVVSTHAKRGNFLFIPYGPVVDHAKPSIQKQALRDLTAYLKDFSQKNGYSFLRISPFIESTKDVQSSWQELGYKKAPLHALAETTWLLDLQPDEDTILMNMNKNHRNLIRRCIKEGARVEIRSDRGALDQFNTLHDTTASRHQFHRFSPEYITKEFDALGQNHAIIFHAYLPDGSLDASAIIAYYGNMAAYRHGASLGKNNKIPTSYLLQWEAIREAKKRGMRWYNFWGIAPENAPKSHPFYGITHFKKGFGGEVKNLLPCQDYIISKSKYFLTWTIETLRKTKRGF